MYRHPAEVGCYDPTVSPRSDGTHLVFYVQQGQIPWYSWTKLREWRSGEGGRAKKMRPGYSYFIRVWRQTHWLRLISCELTHERYVKPWVVDCSNADGLGFIFGKNVHYRYGI